MKKKYYIIIAGNIATGKTTLAGLLARKLEWQILYEPFVDNPYLSKAYLDKANFGFKSQIYFLSNHLKQHLKCKELQSSIIKDCSIYESVNIYAKNMYDRNLMDQQDWNTYYDLYQTLIKVLPKPDLIIYLYTKVSTIQERIATRGRDFEKEITEDNIDQLKILYEQWIENNDISSIIKIDTDKYDFLNNEKDLNHIIDMIESELDI